MLLLLHYYYYYYYYYGREGGREGGSERGREGNLCLLPRAYATRPSSSEQVYVALIPGTLINFYF